jgi:hypothetical protein
VNTENSLENIRTSPRSDAMKSQPKPIWRIEPNRFVSSLRSFAETIDITHGNKDRVLAPEELEAYTAEQTRLHQELVASGSDIYAEQVKDALEQAGALGAILAGEGSLAKDVLLRFGAPVHYERFRDVVEDLFGARLPPNP